jgi:hypothetical protein
MINWWNTLPLFSQILYVIAVPSTIILIVQLIITFTTDLDEDMPEDSEVEGVDSDLEVVSIFTFRGIIAFLCSFSWVTLALFAVNVPIVFAGIIGFAVGVAMMFAVAKLIRVLLGLAESGTVNFQDAIGCLGTVYIPIPAENSGTGKIIVTFQGSERECEAVTADAEAIPTGTEITVTELRGDDILVVTALQN